MQLTVFMYLFAVATLHEFALFAFWLFFFSEVTHEDFKVSTFMLPLRKMHVMIKL